VQHDPYSPSNFGRYVKCSGAAKLEEFGYSEPPSRGAKRGTKIHAAVLEGEDTDRPDDAEAAKEIDKALRAGIQDWLDSHQIAAKPTEVSQSEIGIAVHDIHGERFTAGTIDRLVYAGDHALVVDLKTFPSFYRTPLLVEWQTLLYALGVSTAFYVDVVDVLEVYGDGETVSYSYDRTDFQRAFEEIEALKAVLAGDIKPTFRPGLDQCRYCRAKTICPAMRTEFEAVRAMDPSGVFEVIAAAGSEDLQRVAPLAGQVLSAAKMAAAWAKAAEFAVRALAKAGVEIPGWKTIWAKGRRVFTDKPNVDGLPDALKVTLTDDDLLEALLKRSTPGELEKIYAEHGGSGELDWGSRVERANASMQLRKKKAQKLLPEDS
jgi:CRISPR/Cas system-associated exonuclease Cas4 (RecB family)